MPEQRFLPWVYRADALAVRIERAVIDGSPIDLERTYSRDTAHLGLAGSVIHQRLAIDLVVTDEAHELAEALPDGESPDPALAITLRVTIRNTRTRHSIRCQRVADNVWKGTVELKADEVSGRIEVTPFAVRATGRKPLDGFAFRKGERLAGGPPLRVDLDSSPALPGHSFQGEWLEFGATSSPPELRQRSDLGWFLDLTNPEEPRLLLNSGIEGFRQLLEIPARTGKAARLRDAITHSVLQPVLSTLATEALSSMAAQEEPPAEGWRFDLLTMLAGKARDSTPEKLLEEWLVDWRGANRGAVLQDLETAIQRHIGFQATIAHLTREFQSEGQSS